MSALSATQAMVQKEQSTPLLAADAKVPAKVPVSAPVPATSQVTASTSSVAANASQQIRTPDATTFQHACKQAILDDKPIMMDYWIPSLEKSVIIGVKTTGEKLLVKSEDEYTSPIVKIYKTASEYIIATENSIYLVDTGIATKRIA